MALSDLKTTVYDLLDIATTNRSGYDTLCLAAFNMARVYAERNHDWTDSEAAGYLSVAASGGSLLSASQASFSSGAPSGSTVSIKSVKRAFAYNSDDATWVPALFIKSDLYFARIDRGNRLVAADDVTRSELLSEQQQPQMDVWSTRVVFYWQGGRVFTNMSTNTIAKFDSRMWFTAYASLSDTPTDFLYTHGSDFLVWYAVKMLNSKAQHFVGKNEGSIDPSFALAMQEEAWRSLILFNEYRHDTQQQILAE